METPKTVLLGKTLNEIQHITQNLGMPKFAAKQIVSWLYEKKVVSIDEMTNLSLKHREMLKQVGCKMNCKFCMTGKQGFTANLTANQILNQIYSIPERDTLTNLVFMGMGEPFDNLDEVLKVLEILTSDYGYHWSPKRITVSSVGLKKGLERFLNESDCHLAISMHTPFPSQRKELMPAERAFSITEIVDILRNYDFSKQRRLSFEYIVFKDVNDSLVYAKEIVKLLRGIDCRINLIRFHAIPNVNLEGTDMETMVAFRDYLTQHGVFATIRASRGEDIFAACGMLSTAKQQKEKGVTL